MKLKIRCRAKTFNSLQNKRYFGLPSAMLFILFMLCLVLIINSCGKRSTQASGLRRYLPREEIGDWKRKDVPQEYKGEDLYLYINGGAEIYHEYGFERVIVQDYINENGKSLSLEIFEMKSPESAFGIYTFKTSRQGKTVAVGHQGCLEDYYLNFWKGKFLVTITGFDEDQETIRGLESIAHAIDAKLKNTGNVPSLVALLTDKDLKESSVKYFKGNLGLFNNYQFFHKNIFSLKEGARGDYRTGHSVFIIKYESSEECLKVFNKAKENFRESSRYRNYKVINEMGIQVVGSQEKLIFVSFFQRYILIIVGASSFQKAEDALSLIQEKIKLESK